MMRFLRTYEDLTVDYDIPSAWEEVGEQWSPDRHEHLLCNVKALPYRCTRTKGHDGFHASHDAYSGLSMVWLDIHPGALEKARATLVEVMNL